MLLNEINTLEIYIYNIQIKIFKESSVVLHVENVPKNILSKSDVEHQT